MYYFEVEGMMRHFMIFYSTILLIGNKLDLANDSGRDVSFEEAKQFATENGLLFIECSAKSGENVEELFLNTAKKIYQDYRTGFIDPYDTSSGVMKYVPLDQPQTLDHRPARGRDCVSICS